MKWKATFCGISSEFSLFEYKKIKYACAAILRGQDVLYIDWMAIYFICANREGWWEATHLISVMKTIT